MSDKTERMPSGHGWAYFGVIIGLLASITMNVSSTVLSVSDVALQLRVPIAVSWPVFVGIGIEVLTRIEWRRGFAHWFARLLLIGPMTLVAIVVSYLHGRHVLGLAGEHELAVNIGPLAVDATLFGCTVALLVTRKAGRGIERERKSLAERVAAMRENVKDVAAAATGKDAEPTVEPTPEPTTTPDLDQELADMLEAEKVRPISPPKSPASNRSYAPRGSWDAVKAVALIQDGELGDQAIADLVGTGVKSIQRARRAYRALHADPRATVPAEWKVPGHVVDIIRREVSR